MHESGQPAPRQWEPSVWGDLALFDGGNGEEADDSDGEEDGRPAGQRLEVTLESRPFGVELQPASASGHGALLARCGAQASAAGAEPGSRLLAINQRPVDDLPTTEIRSELDEAPLPVTLSLKPSLSLPSAKKMKARARDPVTVCTAHCRGSYRVVQTALSQLQWKEVMAETREASVVWLEHSDPTDGFAPVQIVTRLDAFIHICRKAPLARCLNRWAKEFPEEFAFTPPTWILPDDSAELESAMSKGKAVYIAKPSTGTQGRGIVLARKWNDFAEILQKSKAMTDSSGQRPNPLEYVVQRYIADPLLINDLKFDLRIYAVVTSVVPLRAYLFKEGLARFATVPYQPPKEANLQEACMHLTNFAVNKQSKDFQPAEGLSNHDEGSKRSISSVLWQISETYGVTADSMWDKISGLVSNTLVALRPQLVEFYAQKKNRPLHPLAPKGFQIIGLDVLLDSNLQPHLLELNANPSLSITQPGGAGGAEEPAEQGPGSMADAAEAPARAREPSGEATPPAMPSSSGGEASRPAIPAGSGARVARAARADERLAGSGGFGGSAGAARGRGTRAGSASPACSDERRTILDRLSDKLQLLSGKDLLLVEASIDSLLADATEGGTSRVKAPSPAPAGSAVERARPAQKSGAGERAGSLASKSRRRLGVSRTPSISKGSKKNVVSQLDLEIKRELIAQALLLARPAPLGKVEKLRKQWLRQPVELDELIPLDDEGAWLRADIPEDLRPEVRDDAPERCPAFEALDLWERGDPEELTEYARAHLGLYRSWLRACGPSQDTLGQAQMQKMLEKRGFVGSGALFPDKVTAQLWLARTWRSAAGGAFGLDFPQFLQVVGLLGDLLLAAGNDEEVGADPAGSAAPSIRGVLEFVRRSTAAAPTAAE